MLKKLLLLSLLTFSTLYGMDQRLFKYPDAKSDYVKATQEKDQSAAFDLALFYDKKLHDKDKAIEWYKKSYALGSGRAAHNLGLLYEKNNKDYKNAIYWYQKAYSEKGISVSAVNLGVIYEKQYQNYNEAILWYKKAYDNGELAGANGLGFLYNTIIKDEEKGMFWYKKAAKGGYSNAINNLVGAYEAKGDKLTASAYTIALINYGYSKKQVMSFLKQERKIDRETLEKAYKLQQSLDIPKHYTGGID